MHERRLHERAAVAFQVRVSSVTNPEVSAVGEAVDISRSGIGINLPVPFTPGSLVQLEIADSSLCGFVAYSRKWAQPTDAPFARNKVWINGYPGDSGIPQTTTIYQTGIEVVEALVGTSGLSQLLKITLEEAMPNLAVAHADQP